MKFLDEPKYIDTMVEIVSSDEAGFFTRQATSVSGWLAIHG